MTPFTQIQKGVAAYLDNEVMPMFKDEGWKRVAAGALIALTIQRSDKFLPIITTNQFVKSMELADEEGNIDIESLVPLVKAQIEKEPLSVNVPMIGNLIFRSSDVDKIYDYIRSAQ